MAFKYKKHTYTPWKKTSDILAAEEKKKISDSAYNTFVNNGFNFSKKQDYTDAYNAWMGREDFSYDFNKDALYQQYKDKYIKQGKMAMADTMGQASAMTGGYGNSYAATAGNQAYQASLENLNDVIPELYQMAYDRYNQKGQDMLNTLSLLGNERSYERGIYESDLGRLSNDRSYYATEADNIFARDYGIWDSNRTYDQGEHQAAEGYRYQNERDVVADEQWEKDYDLEKVLNDVTEDENGNLIKKKTEVIDDDDDDDSPKKPGPGPVATDNTNQFIATIQTKAEYMRRGYTAAQYNAYIEDKLASFLRSDRLTEDEVKYLINHYELE